MFSRFVDDFLNNVVCVIMYIRMYAVPATSFFSLSYFFYIFNFVFFLGKVTISDIK